MDTNTEKEFMYHLPGEVYAYGPVEAVDVKEARKKIRKFWGMAPRARFAVWEFNRASMQAIVDSNRP
jgi:hypothetical protein